MSIFSRMYELFFGWMLVPDTEPLCPAEAIYVPAHGLDWQGTRLARIGAATTVRAIKLYHNGYAPLIILSYGYGGIWEREMQGKLQLFDAAGVPRDKLVHLSPPSGQTHTDSRSEMEWLRIALEVQKIKRLIVVAEEWHLMRLNKWLPREFPGIQFSWINVECEPEPRIKGFNTVDGIWQAWNLLFSALTPLVIKKR